MTPAELKGHKFPVLDDGFVALIDVMGDDSDIVQAARTSYQKGTKKLSDDRGLIRYLMSHRHTTPFEMAELKFMVRVPMDCWRQWIRHRMASVNEYSTRYSEAIDSTQKTHPDRWRAQATSNRQGSAGFVSDWPDGYEPHAGGVDAGGDSDVGAPPETYRMFVPSNAEQPLGGTRPPTPGEFLSARENELQCLSNAIYKERLEFGVAREQARKDLPLSTYTEAFWKIDLHNLLHFLGLRMDSHAQQEIREYATIIGEQIVKPLFPLVWEAFVDFRMESMSLSRLEIEAIRRMLSKDAEWASIFSNVSQREREAAIQKFSRLGL